jgi:hypothetical protein
MIYLTSPVWDLNGYLAIDANPSNSYGGARRGSVTETLDGGVSVYDTGFSVADTTLKVAVSRPTTAMLESLRYLVAYYSQIVVACDSGCYSAILAFNLNGPVLNITLRLTGRLD